MTFTRRGPLNESALRHASERLVLNVLRRNPAVSRADIVRITGMGGGSIVADLNDAVIACKSVRWHRNYDLFFDKVHTVLRSLVEPFAKEHILGVGRFVAGLYRQGRRQSDCDGKPELVRRGSRPPPPAAPAAAFLL